VQLVNALLLSADLAMCLGSPLQTVGNQKVVGRSSFFEQGGFLYIRLRRRGPRGAFGRAVACQSEPLGLPSPVLAGVLQAFCAYARSAACLAMEA